MKRALSNFIIFISILGGIYYGLPLLESGNIYGFLVKILIVITILIPRLMNLFCKIRIPDSLELVYVIFIFLSHFLGSIVDLYHQISWYDTFIHFLSGIFVSIVATYIITKTKIYQRRYLWIWFLFILGISSLVAECWEIFEFLADKLFKADAQNVLLTGVDDTMVDLIVALLGSVLYGILFIYEQVNDLNGITNSFLNKMK